MRVKIRKIEHKMEGRQVILNVEKVNEELGEIICTPVAVSGEAPFIELVKDKDYTVTYSEPKPAPPKNELQEAIRELETAMGIIRPGFNGEYK